MAWHRTLVPPPLELVALALVPEFVVVEVAVTVEPALPEAEALEVTVPPIDVYVDADGEVPPLAVALPAIALPAPKARPSMTQDAAESFETVMEHPTNYPVRWALCTALNFLSYFDSSHQSGF